MNPPDSSSLFLRLQMRLAASRFFTFSLLLHVILVVMAGSVVLVRQMESEPADFASGGSEFVRDEMPVAPPPIDPPPLDAAVAPAAPAAVAPAPDVVVNRADSPASFQLPAAALAVMNREMGDPVPTPRPATVLIGTPGPPLYTPRGPQGREMARQKMGGKEKAERAVMAGLRWLKEHQSVDGSWSEESAPAMTGLALLCFLGHGELPESPEFGPTVKKGIDWLLENGTRHQGRLSMEKAFTQSGVYAHGIAAYALAEYFTMTRDDRAREVLTQAVRHIVDGQAPDGGWQYAFAKGPESDTSVSGWQVQALKAAHLTGLQIPGADEALEKAMPNLKRVQDESGNFGYKRAGDRGGNPSLAGVGVLCTYFWKGEKDALVRDGIKFLLAKAESDFPVKYRGEKADLYAWYYHTQACLQFGGSAWVKWNRWFQDEITNAQSPDGSWPPTGNPRPHGPEAKPGGAGPYYRTTLCVLMLEVFYRYMPTSK